MRSAFHGPAAVPSSPRQSQEDESVSCSFSYALCLLLRLRRGALRFLHQGVIFFKGNGKTARTIDINKLEFLFQDTQLSQPVLSKNRYGREEVLVLMPPNPRAPNGLSNCPFFVEVPREPLAHTSPSDLEEVSKICYSSISLFGLAFANEHQLFEGDVLSDTR